MIIIILSVILGGFLYYSTYAYFECSDQAQYENFQQEQKAWQDKYGEEWSVSRGVPSRVNVPPPPVPERADLFDVVLDRWLGEE